MTNFISMEKFRSFNWKRLSNVRGKAHEGIIGAWIDWWIGFDPKKNMVFNPAPSVEKRFADIAFLREIDGIHIAYGFAEIENDPKKWTYKLDTLRAYERHNSSLEFLLLCVTTKSTDEKKFQELVQQTKNLSKESRLNWILYRLTKIPWTEDTNLILKEDETIWSYESIQKGELFAISEGKEITRTT